MLGLSVRSLFCLAVLCVPSNSTITSLGKRELADFLLLCSEWHVTAIVISLFLAMPLVGL